MSSLAIGIESPPDRLESVDKAFRENAADATRQVPDTQADLRKLEKMNVLGQLAAGLAHEIGNSIGFVHANLCLLEEQTKKLTDHQNAERSEVCSLARISPLLARSLEGTRRVKTIVENIRAFARLDPKMIQDADLHEQIDRTLALMDTRLENISVVRDYDRLPMIRCSVDQINQVFTNLLMNACDAIGSEGQIRITTSSRNESVRLQFRDDGPGISEEVKGQIFDTFFTTKATGRGTGLGLSHSREIVENHGGRISVESEPGRGAQFTIDLPLVARLKEALP